MIAKNEPSTFGTANLLSAIKSVKAVYSNICLLTSPVVCEETIAGSARNIGHEFQGDEEEAEKYIKTSASVQLKTERGNRPLLRFNSNSLA